MRTMFVSHDKSAKKTFQKPNILRKKSKIVSKSNVQEGFQSPDSTALGTQYVLKEVNTEETHPAADVSPIDNHTQFDLITQADRSEQSKNFKLIPGTSDCTYILNNNSSSVVENIESKGNEENANNVFVNIESFFSDAAAENVTLYGFDCDPGASVETLLVIDNKSPTSSVCMKQNSEKVTNVLPPSAVSIEYPEINQTETENPAVQTFYSQIQPPVIYKCGVNNCHKEFRREQKFKRHMSTHGEDGTIKAPRQVTVECPVKKVEADGTENACGKIFLIRDELLKHLNDDHTLDDAVYRCEECGRRFFWASGLRAHARAHCRRAAGAGPGAGGGAGAERGQLVCAWAGCGRVFRQPCRLREHARAHTGDRPYPCDYPNCGWSFRSASKLMRHARRHTGERRHACALCGFAFLRREHLRDHAARHHAARRPHPCTHDGCEQTFSNMSTLYLHMKKVHKKKESSPPATTTGDSETFFPLQKTNWNIEEDNVIQETSFTDDISAEGRLDDTLETVSGTTELCEDDASEVSGEWHAARTHCTWPLETRPVRAAAEETMLKDDSQVEQLEGSESNTYTVRSDLFLHGNVLINEDSQIGGVAAAGDDSSAGADALGADLGLLDAHPTIGLMQEELMYADSAADESSFRIFLLSGEELT